MNTREQRDCKLWKEARQKRLTASVFGKICNMRSTTSVKKTVHDLLYETNATKQSIPAIKYGVKMEKFAKSCFESQTGKVVRDSGLYIDQEHPWLAASPGINDSHNIQIHPIKNSPKIYQIFLLFAPVTDYFRWSY